MSKCKHEILWKEFVDFVATKTGDFEPADFVITMQAFLTKLAVDCAPNAGDAVKIMVESMILQVRSMEAKDE